MGGIIHGGNSLFPPVSREVMVGGVGTAFKVCFHCAGVKGCSREYISTFSVAKEYGRIFFISLNERSGELELESLTLSISAIPNKNGTLVQRNRHCNRV